MGVQYRTTQRANPFAINPTKTVPPSLASKLGSGLQVPASVINNAWQVSSGLDKVKQDIYVTLTTPPGSRLYQLDFGSELYYLLFEPYDANLRQEMIIATQTALNTWVKTINVNNVLIDDSNINQNYLIITIAFSIKGTNSSDTFSMALIGPNTVQLPASTFQLGVMPFLKV